MTNFKEILVGISLDLDLEMRPSTFVMTAFDGFSNLFRHQGSSLSWSYRLYDDAKLRL